MREGDTFGRGRGLRLVLVFVDNCVPGISLDVVDLIKEIHFFGLLCFPRVGLDKAKFAHLLVLHEPALHSALKVLDLEIPASLGDELVLDNAVGVLLGLLVALVEVIEGEGASIGCLGHYNYL